ncbi:MAG: hypothetical protein HC854_12040 [Flavobacterium sp.]|nr:hypothetical protein [Flavobacterium sp.]
MKTKYYGKFSNSVLNKKELGKVVGGDPLPTEIINMLNSALGIGIQFTIHAPAVNPNQGLQSASFAVGGNINFSNNPESGNLIPHEGSHTSQNSSSSYK